MLLRVLAPPTFIACCVVFYVAFIWVWFLEAAVERIPFGFNPNTEFYQWSPKKRYVLATLRLLVIVILLCTPFVLLVQVVFTGHPSATRLILSVVGVSVILVAVTDLITMLGFWMYKRGG